MMEVQATWFTDQPDLGPERLVFLDETAANTEMAHVRAGPRGGDALILDSLPAQDVASVCEAIATVTAQSLDLRACAPDINSVEHAFAMIKALLRKAIVRRFGLPECCRRIAAAGYDAVCAASGTHPK